MKYKQRDTLIHSSRETEKQRERDIQISINLRTDVDTYTKRNKERERGGVREENTRRERIYRSRIEMRVFSLLVIIYCRFCLPLVFYGILPARLEVCLAPLSSHSLSGCSLLVPAESQSTALLSPRLYNTHIHIHIYIQAYIRTYRRVDIHRHPISTQVFTHT